MLQPTGPDHGPLPDDQQTRHGRRGGRRRLVVRAAMAALLALGVTSLLGSTAVAAPARPQSQVSIFPVAVRADGGATLTVSVVVRCAPTDHMMEGFATVEQGEIALLTGFEVVCDGRRHLAQATFSASDASGQQLFRTGRAAVRAIIFDEHTGTSVAESLRTVLVRGHGCAGR